LSQGKVEVDKRATKESHELAIEEVVATIKQWIDAEIGK
jgi:prolyl-tRNA synthetase